MGLFRRKPADTPQAPKPATEASAGRIVDLTSEEFKQAQENAASQGARVGDTHAGYRVVSVKDGAQPDRSVVMAENVSAEGKPKYVVWTLDRRLGGGYKSGAYRDDSKEAQKAFDSRQR